MARFLGLGSGKDGVIALGSYTPLKYSCSGSSGATSLSATGTFSAGDRLFIHQTRGTGAGNYEDNRVASYATGTVTLVHPLENNYTDSGASQAQVLVVKEASGVTGSITVPAWDGDVGGIFVMACSGDFSGTVDVSGKGFRGGDKTDYPQGHHISWSGEGNTGASTQSIDLGASSNAGGAGQEPNNNGGAGGGHATAGANANLSIGGRAVGQAELTSLFMGGGGGGGAAGGGDNRTGIAGAAGGGIIVVYAGSFSSTAQLTANGATAASSASNFCGGGGAGGSILIKGRSIAVGSSKLSAVAGTGGVGIISGGNGGTGRIRLESCSLSGTSSPTASSQTGGFSYCGTNIAIL